MLDEREYSSIEEDDELVQTTRKLNRGRLKKVNTKSFKVKTSTN